MSSGMGESPGPPGAGETVGRAFMRSFPSGGEQGDPPAFSSPHSDPNVLDLLKLMESIDSTSSAETALFVAPIRALR